ncbi:MAG TPA: hypothetical protein VMU30_07665 [Bacteroidota bacterium]|nr:hypothetical protein [Bacteroidota bacterium]
MIAFFQSHPECVEETIALAISDDQPFSWRAAWLLGSCIESDDKRIRKHVPTIIRSIKSKNDGHQRELIKILLRMNVPEKYEGLVFDLCMNLWEQQNKDPSVRMTSLKFILKVAQKHPTLSKEVTALTQDRYLESLSPGIKKSVSKMMKEFIR